MSRKGHVPVRMCVGCRTRKGKEEMLRFGIGPEGARVAGSRSEGRGFYLCRDLKCLRTARKKSRLGPALESMDDLSFLSLKGTR
jgi:uncharacterized protein